jgi:hypothetical protein
MSDTRDEVERVAIVLHGDGPITLSMATVRRLVDENQALRQRAEAAEAERDAAIEAVDANWVTHQAVAEARAQAAAAWEAAAAWVDAGIYMGSNKKGQAEFSPMTGAYLLTCRPADASAALTARLDAERRACATECEMCPDENWGQWMAARIMARCEGE